MTVTSGRKCCELLKSCGPVGSLVKMLLESSIWRSTRCYLTWKAAVTPARRLYFRLVPRTPRTDGTEFALLGTPTAQSKVRSKAFREGRTPNPAEFAMMRPTVTASDWKRREPNSHQQGLAEATKLRPTPTQRDYKGANSAEHLTRDSKRNHTDQLANAVKLFPTPTVQDYKSRGPNSKQQGLPEMVKMFPMPTTGAGMCGGSGNYQQLKDLVSQGVISEEERRSMASGSGGQLNPDWVEWLMGFPIGWTDPEREVDKSTMSKTGEWLLEPDIPRIATGIKNRVNRLKCLGNAVVPQQFYPVFQAIAEIEKGESQ